VGKVRRERTGRGGVDASDRKGRRLFLSVDLAINDVGNPCLGGILQVAV